MYYLWKSGLPHQGCGYSSYFRGYIYLFPLAPTRGADGAWQEQLLLWWRKKKRTYRNFHEEEKKSYRCKFKTNKLNAQLGHVCFVFAFLFIIDSVSLFCWEGGEKTPMIIVCMHVVCPTPQSLCFFQRIGSRGGTPRIEEISARNLVPGALRVSPPSELFFYSSFPRASLL